MTGSLSTRVLLTGTTVGEVTILAFGLAMAARRAGLAHSKTLAASVAAGLIRLVSIRQSLTCSVV